MGNIKLKFKQGSTSFTLKNVYHVLEFIKSLILTKQLDDEGYNCVYGENSWKITKGSMVVVQGVKLGVLYMLHVRGVKDHVIYVIEQSILSLWHC